MSTTYADIHVKVNKDIKNQSEKILDSIGISMSDLINMTLRRLILERQIPFSTKVKVDGAPESMTVSNIEELKAMLGKMLDDDDGVRMGEDEVWSDFREHVRSRL